MLELINWMKDGKYRAPVLELIQQRSHLPSELAESLKVDRAYISRVLKALKEKELVDTITSQSRTTSYVITKKGSTLLKKLEQEMK